MLQIYAGTVELIVVIVMCYCCASCLKIDRKITIYRITVVKGDSTLN
jgi:hypothetical protein